MILMNELEKIISDLFEIKKNLESSNDENIKKRLMKYLRFLELKLRESI
jgi:hypothetical protein